MKTITLRNDFHGSSTSVRISDGAKLTASQINRARRALCGVSGCTCSNSLGTRGPQEVEVVETYDGTLPHGDGFQIFLASASTGS